MSNTEPSHSRSESLVITVTELWGTADAPSVEEIQRAVAAGTPRGVADALLVDQRQRWANGDNIPAERYLQFVPDPTDAETRIDLLYGEFIARGRTEAAGEDLLSRFPDDATALQKQIGVGSCLKLDAGRPADTFIVDSDAKAGSLPLSAPDATAPLLLSDYELIRNLGRGAMGEVWLATQTSLNKQVAIKRLLPRQQARPEFVSRFLHEARMTASLRHPNIVGVHGIGRDEDGGYFIVMDFIDGQQLASDGPANSEAVLTALDDIRTASRAIGYAHSQGLVHRDIKPANLLKDADHNLHVVDFGLSRGVESDDLMLTAAGDVIGTPAFMAPEQVSDDLGPVGPRTDIYGLGATLYMLLTGQSPIPGEHTLSVLSNLVRGVAIEPPSTFNPNVSPEVDALCMKCLSRQPADRFPSAIELSQAIETLPEMQGRSPHEQGPPLSRSHRPYIAMIAVGIAFVAGTLLVQAMKGPANSDTPQHRQITSQTTPESVQLTWSISVLRSSAPQEPAPLTGSVQTSDRIRVRTELESVRHIAAFWISSDGEVQFLADPSSLENPVRSFSMPRDENAVVPIEGPPGTECLVLLLSSSQIDDVDELTSLVGSVPRLEPMTQEEPIVDGLTLRAKSSDGSEAIASLEGGSRGIGEPEAIAGGDASKALMKLRSRVAKRGYELHFLLLNHTAPDDS